MVRFDRVHFDAAARVLELDGEPCDLEPQAFDVLAHLIAHRDRVVSKEELLDHVWGDQFVSESALTTRIKQIRRALGDDGERQAVIRNFRGRGYRFVAAVEDPAAHAAPRDGIVGRDRDLEVIDGQLASHRVVTLVGPGGVGKTTLSRVAAARAAERFRGGVVTLELAPVRDADDVVPALRRAVGLTDPAVDEEALLAATTDLGALLVIDNCEHVIEEVARLARSIDDHGGATRILATSRERLGVAAEQVHRVLPLDAAAARALLVARARAARPGFEIEIDDEDAVTALLAMVDRLPLAIEMAAARLGSLTVTELTSHLTGRVHRLRAPDRGTDERHRTVAALVEWSEALLDEPSRALLADLSVFAGPVLVEDIAEVVGTDATDLMLGPLGDLVDHSLVVVEIDRGPTRYRLLETVRAVVSPRQSPSAEERHARHVAAVVRAAEQRRRTPEEHAAVARIDDLVEEIRAAHRWARTNDLGLAADLTTSLLSFSQERLWSEPARWSREALGMVGDGDDRAPFAASLAADAAHRGDYDEARSMGEVALTSPEPVVVACGHDTLANVGVYDGDAESALAHGTALTELGSRLGDATIWTLGLLARVLAPLYQGGRTAEARTTLDQRSAPGPLSPTSAAWVAYAEGEVLAAEGHDDQAILRFERSIDDGASVGSAFVVGVARTSLHAARARAGSDDALAELATVLEQHRRSSGVTHAITTMRNLIGVLVRADEDELAMVLLGALSDPAVKATYGSESTLLEDARATVVERHGADAVDGWMAIGAAHDAEWAVDHAISRLRLGPQPGP